ncbi:hypothetical protein F5J12DRAFT_786324 [Pisolithus orientalis]|uniref:uncharacterized protein n=1 Tax=Pisolithus orientalis TaxID=936130 RepID=UPI002224A8D0|nr:uncharacterized protein F5J12DRAFT_786324 [Pisolithus orientalis]KAI5991681.1 hypothetical protein F5J12DRAFT_786324 [Pisolithus orientalis]
MNTEVLAGSSKQQQQQPGAVELEYQSLKEDPIEAPAVSWEAHQLTDDLLVSKIPFEFEAERLKEHTKHTRVEVKELGKLTDSLEAKRLADKVKGYFKKGQDQEAIKAGHTKEATGRNSAS